MISETALAARQQLEEEYEKKISKVVGSLSSKRGRRWAIAVSGCYLVVSIVGQLGYSYIKSIPWLYAWFSDCCNILFVLLIVWAFSVMIIGHGGVYRWLFRKKLRKEAILQIGPLV